MFLSDINMVETNGTGRIKLLHQCGGESNCPKLILYYTKTWKYYGKEENLQVIVVLCLPTWMGPCSSGHGSHWAKAGPGGNLWARPAKPKRIRLVELTVPWDTANFQAALERKTATYERLTEYLIKACFDAPNPPLKIRCKGVINMRNAANLEYIWNQVWIRAIKKLKGSLIWEYQKS